MEKKDLKRFAKILQEEKTKILNHNDKMIDEDLSLNPDDLHDEVDLASSELNQNIKMRLKDRERLLLQKIERALAKIEDGSFGFCEVCEESIEVKRLEARPVANLCIQCKEAEERNEKNYAEN